MHASVILRRCLPSVLGPMHAARCRVLLSAVEALVLGRRLTLTDLARSWPGATWMHAPLKALDRLLSNPLLAVDVRPLHQAMARWLLKSPQPLIVVDWSDLKGGSRWCLLRAAVPIGGRALTLYEQAYPIAQLSQPKVQAAFLTTLKQMVPASITPIIVTDAGFRSDWCRAVVSLGWHYVARIRNNTKVRAVGQADWQPCATMFALARASARDLGDFHIVRQDPMPCRLLIARRKHAQCATGAPPKMRTSARKAYKAAREPWLLATSLNKKERVAARVVAIYAQRMQIEEAFRDLKSHRYGVAFEDSLTRGDRRITILLMLHTLATFAAWIIGCAGTAARVTDPLTRQANHRSRYSTIRRGFEWLRKRWAPHEDSAWLKTPIPPTSPYCLAGQSI